MRIRVPAFNEEDQFVISKPNGIDFKPEQQWLATGYVYDGLDEFDFEQWEPAPEPIQA